MLFIVLIILTGLIAFGIFFAFFFTNYDNDLPIIFEIILFFIFIIGWGVLGTNMPQKTVHTTQMVVVSQTPAMTIFSDKDKILYSTADHQVYQAMKEKTNIILHVTSKLNMYGGKIHTAYSTDGPEKQ